MTPAVVWLSARVMLVPAIGSTAIASDCPLLGCCIGLLNDHYEAQSCRLRRYKHKSASGAKRTLTRSPITGGGGISISSAIVFADRRDRNAHIFSIQMLTLIRIGNLRVGAAPAREGEVCRD